jgi:NAD(P)-dependent dehydrogenase (short-subunit alcohol dehydrogenase family)
MLINRWGKTSDLVGPTIFLLSNASNYITGSDIYVDGGWMAR